MISQWTFSKHQISADYFGDLFCCVITISNIWKFFLRGLLHVTIVPIHGLPVTACMSVKGLVEIGYLFSSVAWKLWLVGWPGRHIPETFPWTVICISDHLWILCWFEDIELTKVLCCVVSSVTNNLVDSSEARASASSRGAFGETGGRSDIYSSVHPLLLGQSQVRGLMIGRDDSGHVWLWGFGGRGWKLGWNLSRLEFSKRRPMYGKFSHTLLV